MKLYGSLTSPYVRKVRILLAEKGIDYIFVESTPAPDNRELALVNPLGKVPALVLDDGQLLFDSSVHVEYIDQLCESAFIPAGEGRWEVQRWHALGNGICDAVVARMLERRRSENCQSAELIARQEQKVRQALDYAEARVGEEPFLLGRAMSLADIALGVALEYIDLRYPHPWREQRPRLTAWLGPISARSAFQQTAPPAG